MKNELQLGRKCTAGRAGRSALVAALALLWVAALPAQSLQEIDAPAKPLTLKARGSFYVGGEQVEQTAVELGGFGPADRVTINQMYVEYMVPAGKLKVPVVMVHGATLSGKTYDTTPDGRMGWYEYFVRKNHPVYVVDQIGRARSGFNQAVFNNVRAGASKPADQPSFLRLADRFGAWTNFRFGPAPGEAFPNMRFPADAVDELSKQSVPDLLGTSREANPNWKALADLAAELRGAVLLVHSQSGPYPLESALINATGIRGIVMVEPGTCNAKVHTNDEIVRLAKIPIYVMFGDNLSADTKLPGPSWQDRFEDCQEFAERIEAVGGDIQVLSTVETGVRGNTHMLMMDQNSLELGDLILAWINEKTVATKRKN